MRGGRAIGQHAGEFEIASHIDRRGAKPAAGGSGFFVRAARDEHGEFVCERRRVERSERRARGHQAGGPIGINDLSCNLVPAVQVERQLDGKRVGARAPDLVGRVPGKVKLARERKRLDPVLKLAAETAVGPNERAEIERLPQGAQQ